MIIHCLPHTTHGVLAGDSQTLGSKHKGRAILVWQAPHRLLFHADRSLSDILVMSNSFRTSGSTRGHVRLVCAALGVCSSHRLDHGHQRHHTEIARQR